jgi:hypothetical protein
MLSTRIIDNDMGHVMKLPLTGRGTVHGITVEIDGIKLPEIDMGLLEMLDTDMGVKRFSEHCEEHLNNAEREAAFIESYKTFVTPLNKSGKDRY